MKVIVYGGRNISSQLALDLVDAAIRASGLRDEITEIVIGGEKGIGAAANVWAVLHKIPVKSFPANWEKYGRGAGAIRNQEMASYADGLIAIWDSSGTSLKNMIQCAHDRLLPIYEHGEPCDP